MLVKSVFALEVQIDNWIAREKKRRILEERKLAEEGKSVPGQFYVDTLDSE